VLFDSRACCFNGLPHLHLNRTNLGGRELTRTSCRRCPIGTLRCYAYGCQQAQDDDDQATCKMMVTHVSLVDGDKTNLVKPRRMRKTLLAAQRFGDNLRPFRARSGRYYESRFGLDLVATRAVRFISSFK
jgi:hypothetical protein